VPDRLKIILEFMTNPEPLPSQTVVTEGLPESSFTRMEETFSKNEEGEILVERKLILRYPIKQLVLEMKLP
jgi:hypothetical protein